jgi:ABC-type branched-subunit amino acid transport system substrate-binding protein
MVNLRVINLFILTLIIAGLLWVTACAPTAVAPAPEKVVRIGALPILTGGGATADQPSFQGTLDYVKYFNEAKGIPETSIEIVWMDTATDATRFMSGYRSFVDRGIPLIHSNLTLVLGTIGSHLERDRVPLFTGGAIAPAVYPPGWIFCAWATQGEAAIAVLDYFRENWQGKGSPKLQLLVSETTFGREPAEEIARYAQAQGFDVLPTEFSPLIVIDATPQLLRIRERQADLVYIQNIISAAGPIMRDVERLGLQEKMQFAGTEWILAEPLLKMAPVSVEGFLAPKALPWLDETDIPGIRIMTSKQLEYHGTVFRGFEYMGGWVYGAIMCEAVKRAWQDVGYENLDGAAIKRAFENMRDFNVDDLVKVTFGPDDRRGSTSYAVYQVKEGRIVRVSEWREVPPLVP